jgi:hypothetical protein
MFVMKFLPREMESRSRVGEWWEWRRVEFREGDCSSLGSFIFCRGQRGFEGSEGGIIWIFY